MPPTPTSKLYFGGGWNPFTGFHPLGIVLTTDAVSAYPAHITCAHYRLVGGQAIQVEKGEPYDYCTDDPEDETQARLAEG